MPDPNPWQGFAVSLPALDIQQLAYAIGNEWLYANKDVVRMAIQDLLDGNPEPRPKISILAAAKYMDRITELLRVYDEGRTRHIKFLTGELIRLHSILPAPSVIVKKTGYDNPQEAE